MARTNTMKTRMRAINDVPLKLRFVSHLGPSEERDRERERRLDDGGAALASKSARHAIAPAPQQAPRWRWPARRRIDCQPTISRYPQHWLLQFEQAWPRLQAFRSAARAGPRSA